MTATDTALFEQHRPRLFGLAYRMLGTPADAEDAVHISDGGGLARATLHPLHGADRLARLYLQLARGFAGPAVRYQLTVLNGAPALLLLDGDLLASAMWIESDGERITAIHALRHPEKLARLLAVTKPVASTSLH
jgi:RNA polymerase sigma-70 factor (ECF subfamily)